MSGHSKWATTKRKKAAIDAKRGKIFTKFAKLITIAARDGKSGDINSNPSLRMAVDNAKAASMPKENIQRAIDRGVGGGASAAIEEIVYEAYGPAGMALIIECLTDNKNRTLSEIKNIINKNGGTFANAGSVSYLFKKAGEITIDLNKNSLDREELDLIVLDSGAEDFEVDENIMIIFTDPSSLHSVKNHLEENGVVLDSSELTMLPNAYQDLPDNKKEQAEKLYDTLDDLEDVNKIYHNANL